VDSLADVAGRPRTIDYAGRILLGKDDVPTINFGKHKGKTVREIYQTEPSYFAWIADGDFTLDTKRQFALLKEKYDKEKKELEKERKAMESKPLEGDDFSAALSRLKDKFQGGSLF
jgi:DNA polymerase-3 subunit epsilon